MKNALALIEHPTALNISGEYLDSLCKKSIRVREERLMLAILEDSVQCFLKYLFARDAKGRYLFAGAEEWILEKNCDWIFSFENICETLGVSPSYLRGKLMRWKEEELLPRNKCRAEREVYSLKPRLISSYRRSFVGRNKVIRLAGPSRASTGS